MVTGANLEQEKSLVHWNHPVLLDGRVYPSILLRRFIALSRLAAFQWLACLIASGYTGSYCHAAEYRVRQVSDIVFNAETLALEEPHIVGDRLIFAAKTDRGQELFATDGHSLIEYDIKPGPAGSLPSLFHEWNDALYFVAHGPLGEELYSIRDGAPTLVADILAGPGDSSPRTSFEGFPDVDGEAYFYAKGDGGRALYRTSGSGAEYVAPANTTNAPYMSTINDQLIFSGSGPAGDEFYRTDGTHVSLLADINPGPASAGPYPLFEFNNKLYFAANGTNGRELFYTDGLSVQEIDVNPGPGSSSPIPRVVFENELYFSADRGNGYELFKTDGSNVTEFDIYAGSQGSFALAGYAGISGNWLYFAADGPNGRELFRTDGTTVIDLDINPGVGASNPLFFKSIGDSIYLKAVGPQGNELYKITGDEVKLIDLNPGAALSNPQTQDLVEYNGAIYIEAVGPHGVELFRIEGDIPMEIDLPSGNRGSYPESFMEYNGDLFFSAAGLGGRAVYYTDGQSISELVNLRPLSFPAVPDRSVSPFVSFGDSLYFIAKTPTGAHLFQISVVLEPSTSLFVILGVLSCTLIRCPIELA